MNLFFLINRFVCGVVAFRIISLVFFLVQISFSAEHSSEIAYVELIKVIENLDHNAEKIKELLENSRDDFLSTEKNRQLAAEVAAALGSDKQLDFFLRKGGVNIQSTNEGFAPVFYVAQFKKKMNVINYLKENRINIDQDSVNTYFKRCVKGYAIEAVKLLLTEFDDVPLPDEKTINDVFHDLMQADQVEVIKILINDDYAARHLSNENLTNYSVNYLHDTDSIDKILKSKAFDSFKLQDLFNIMTRAYMQGNLVLSKYFANGISLHGIREKIRFSISKDYYRTCYLMAAIQDKKEFCRFLLDDYKKVYGTDMDLPDQAMVDAEYLNAAEDNSIDLLAMLQTKHDEIPFPSENIISEVRKRYTTVYNQSLINYPNGFKADGFITSNIVSYFNNNSELDAERRRGRLDSVKKYQELRENEANPGIDTYVSLNELKLAYSNLLDFSQISRLQALGLKGDGVKVYISEVFGVRNLPILGCVDCNQSEVTDNHGVNVVGIIRKIASKATLLGGLIDKSHIPADADIVNCSWGIELREATFLPYFKKDPLFSLGFLHYLEKKKTLFVWAADNSNVPIIQKLYSDELHAQLQKDATVMQNMIWVTNITSHGELDSSSSYPGEEFKDHAISAFGTDVEVINNDESFKRNTGTSFSAPIVTGVAVLLKGKFPDFSPFDLKTCLLESADKYWFENYGGNNNKAVFDKDGKIIDDGRRLLDPKKYGKGILNAPNAYRYASILNELRQSNPDIAADDTRVKKVYNQRVQESENDNAHIIQRSLASSPFLVEQVLKPYNERVVKFNNNPTANLSETQKIREILMNQQKVDLIRHAKWMEKKMIIKAIIADRIIQHSTADHFAIPINFVASNDVVSKHFKAIMLAEKIAKAKVLELKGFRVDDLAKEYAELSSICGLDKKTFDMWFDETFKQHEMGFNELLKR